MLTSHEKAGDFIEEPAMAVAARLGAQQRLTDGTDDSPLPRCSRCLAQVGWVMFISHSIPSSVARSR